MTRSSNTDSFFLNKQCIIRTYSSDIWFGTVHQKEHNSIILTNARQILQYKPAQSISTSAIAIYGIDPEQSSIAPTVQFVWIEGIEIIHCTPPAIVSIENASDATAEYNITVQ